MGHLQLPPGKKIAVKPGHRLRRAALVERLDQLHRLAQVLVGRQRPAGAGSFFGRRVLAQLAQDSPEMPQTDPASQGVTRDLRTGRMLYPLDEIREWHKRRPGRGNWGGIGARARQKVSEREAL